MVRIIDENVIRCDGITRSWKKIKYCDICVVFSRSGNMLSIRLCIYVGKSKITWEGEGTGKGRSRVMVRVKGRRR